MIPTASERTLIAALKNEREKLEALQDGDLKQLVTRLADSDGGRKCRLTARQDEIADTQRRIEMLRKQLHGDIL